LRSAIALVLFFATAAFAADNIKVAVCNLGEIEAQRGVFSAPFCATSSSESHLRQAQREAAYVFRAMGIKIQWAGCAEVGAADPSQRPNLIVRLRQAGHIAKVGPVSLEAMGRAFIDDTGYGFMVDTYYGAIRDLTLLWPLAAGDQMLGYVMAHELGHLLLGPGHRPRGIMRATWGREELEAIQHRHLKFDDDERAAILRRLH
jgi:hypothetical protein